MRQQKFRRMLLFLLRKRGYAQQRREERAAQAQYIAALDAEEAEEFSEVYPIHAKRLRKAAHIGKHRAYIAHLGRHFRIDDNADTKHEGDGRRPDNEGAPALPELVLKYRHFRRPPLRSSA